MGGKKSPSTIETVLHDNVALQDLKTLVDAGCNEDELRSLMELIFWTDETWERLVKKDLRTFKKEIGQIRACANIIDRFNRSELVYHASIEIRDPMFVWLNESPSIAEQLRKYADSLDLLRVMFGPKRALRWHAWKAWIVAVVTEDTRAPYDRQVSSLIGAVTDDPEYGEKAHQTWRLDHSDLIEKMRQILLEHRRKRSLSVDPNLVS